jgi:hypothetical protein
MDIILKISLQNDNILSKKEYMTAHSYPMKDKATSIVTTANLEFK